MTKTTTNTSTTHEVKNNKNQQKHKLKNNKDQQNIH